jgi:NAD-dependent dihydropyrimidine dehydrogenase PreA subunit
MAMNKIEIAWDECDGCKACLRACFVNALGWDEAGKKPVVAHAEDCVHCNICELVCGKGCITVTPDFAYMRWSAW